MMGMMGKLQEAQQKMEETKERLNTVLIDETGPENLIKVTVTANKTIKSIQIEDQLLEDKEQLEDYLILTLNKAMDKAAEVQETELGAAAKDGMPDIPGLDMFK